jgi:spermidine/putrescine-binding protein
MIVHLRRLFLLSALAMLAGCGGQGGDGPNGRLNVYIWSSYLPDEVVQEFETAAGVKVNIETYDDNETLERKLQSGVSGFDLVVPSDYMVARLAAQKLIQPLDKAKLPGFANLDPAFLDQAFDPGNQYSLPWVWGTTGIGYNKEKAGGEIDSWSVLFDEKHQGRILMLEDTREVIAAALKSLGRSVNDTSDEAIAAGAEKLKRQKPLVKTYNSGDFANILASGDVDYAHAYNGELAKVVAESAGKLAYVVPKEGGVIWMDNICLVAGAKNAGNAYKFLDFILKPEVSAKIVNDISYAGANRAAKPFIKPELLNDPVIYPPAEVVARCEYMKDLGAAAEKLDAIWTEIKAQ